MEHFHHLPAFRIIICKKCQFGVLPSHINTHFTIKAHELEKAERRRIADEVAEIDQLIGNEETLQRSEFPFPPPTSEPIPELGPPKTNGLQCTFETAGKPCEYICCTERQMRDHRWDEHQWQSKKKGGRPKKHQPNGEDVKGPWRTGVHCQRFFIHGPKARYFEVQGGERQPPSAQEMRSRMHQYRTARQEMEAAFHMAEEQKRREIKEADEHREPNPWLRRVGWAAHLAGFDRADIREWVAVADEDEPELQTVCKAFDWMIREAQYITVQEVVGQAALFEVHRKAVTEEARMPFDSWMDMTTVRSYTHIWRQLLCYVFRAEAEEPEDRPAYKLTERQQISMHGLQAVVREFQDWKTEQSPREEQLSGVERDTMVPDDDEGESDEEIAFMKRIQREVLRFCIDLLNHPLQDNEYKSVIISGLAVLGIREDDGWLSAEDYTPKYSGMAKLARLMVVHEGYEQRQQEIRRKKEYNERHEQGLTDDQIGEKARSYFHYIRRLTHQFMTMAHDGQDPTPMQWIYKARSYGFKIRYTTTAEGCIQWVGDSILYQQIRFSMTQVRSMVQGLVQEAREELFGKLMMVDSSDGFASVPPEAPPIDWDHMVDNPSESRVGWSFLDDERSRFAVNGKWWLYERMFHEQRLREQFTDQGESARPQIQPAAAAAYQEGVTRFQELLLVLMQFWGGLPSRAPEILGLRWKNTGQGGIRNIFIEDGLVAFVAAYHKGYRSSGNIKIIHRYLPKEVGELLVYYLWLVLPFHEKLQFATMGKCDNHSFLWGDSEKKDHRQWTGPKGRQQEGYQGRGHGIGPKGVQERGHGIGPEGVQERGHGIGPKTGAERSLPHSRRSHEWTSERMRKIMQDASKRWIGEKIHISAWRQIAIAISRRCCKEHAFPRDEFEVEGGGGDDSGDDSPWDLQAGHSTHIAGMIYGRELMEGNSAIIDRREKFRQVSQAWHAFLQKTSEGEEARSGVKRKRGDDEDDMPSVEMIRWKRLKEVDIRQQLKEMVGPEAEFRGQQEAALQAIMNGVSQVLVIMGTGGGKTVLFQLPARSQKGGTTVVVVPLKSLEESLHERCMELGISSVQWDANQQERMAQVVFVQPESAISASFARYMNRLQGMGQLVRVVFDECHTILDSQADFRPDMKKASALMVKRGVQMVYLTATLAPTDEAEFREIIRVDIPAENVFRGPTSRANIAYSVIEHDAQVEQTQAVCDLVAQKLQEYPAPAKIIIYSSSIATITELGKALRCPTYHAAVGSAAEKKQIRQRWENGQARVVVASNAFGLGIDQPDARAIVHVGPIYQMKGYGQESGRGGRDGERSEAIIMVGAGQQEALRRQHERMRRQSGAPQVVITKADKQRAEREKVDRFISGARCRRIHLDQAMDGRYDRVRCEEGEEVCDVCQQSDNGMAEADALQQEYDAEQEQRETEQREEEQREEGRHNEPRKRQQEPRLDSGIDIPSSSRIDPHSPAEPWQIPPSSPPVHIAPGWAEMRQRQEETEISGTVKECSMSPSPDSSSVISFDRGYTATPVTMEDRFAFQAQQDEREQYRMSVQGQTQQEGRMIWEFQQQLQDLNQRCPFCVVRQLPHQPHRIRDCVADGVKKVQADWLIMKSAMRERHLFSPYSCCFDCHVPQEICQRWVAKEGHNGRGRWGRIAGNQCQFDEIIMPTVISVMREGEDETQAGIINDIRQQGINELDPMQVYKWLGQKVEWGGMEVSRLIQVFHQVVKRI